MKISRRADRKIEAYQQELIKTHFAEVDNMYRKMRGWRHDYHNHIQTLKAYMSLTQYEEAAKYLELLEKDLTSVDTVLRTGNVMVDAILNSKLSLIQEKDIQVDATAAGPREVPISDIDLSTLYGKYE